MESRLVIFYSFVCTHRINPTAPGWLPYTYLCHICGPTIEGDQRVFSLTIPRYSWRNEQETYYWPCKLEWSQQWGATTKNCPRLHKPRQRLLLFEQSSPSSSPKCNNMQTSSIFAIGLTHSVEKVKKCYYISQNSQYTHWWLLLQLSPHILYHTHRRIHVVPGKDKYSQGQV